VMYDRGLGESLRSEEVRLSLWQPEVRHPSSRARDEDGNLKGPATSQEVSQLPSSLKL